MLASRGMACSCRTGAQHVARCPTNTAAHTVHFFQVLNVQQVGHEPAEGRGFCILRVPILHRNRPVYAANSRCTAVPLLLMVPLLPY